VYSNQRQLKGETLNYRKVVVEYIVIIVFSFTFVFCFSFFFLYTFIYSVRSQLYVNMYIINIYVYTI